MTSGSIRRAADEACLGGLIEPFALEGGWGNRALRKFTVAHVYENGCVYGHHEKDTADAVRWADVARFVQRVTEKRTNGSSTSTTYDFDVVHTDGRLFNLVGVGTRRNSSGLERFAEVVGPLVTEAQLPRFREALSSGEPVEFGWFTVRPEGIGRGRKLLPWAELEEVNVREGKVGVRRHGKRLNWAKAGVPDVPNVGAFLTLTRETDDASWRR
jgi:hypothetical protein